MDLRTRLSRLVDAKAHVDACAISQFDQRIEAEFADPAAQQVVQSRLRDVQPARRLGLGDLPGHDPLAECDQQISISWSYSLPELECLPRHPRHWRISAASALASWLLFHHNKRNLSAAKANSRFAVARVFFEKRVGRILRRQDWRRKALERRLRLRERELLEHRSRRSSSVSSPMVQVRAAPVAVPCPLERLRSLRKFSNFAKRVTEKTTDFTESSLCLYQNGYNCNASGSWVCLLSSLPDVGH